MGDPGDRQGRRLPSEVADRVRAIQAGAPVPEPRDAATVVLLRDADGTAGTRRGIEVLLLHRVRTMAFAAGMHVFPGGTVDPADLHGDVAWAGPPPEQWSARLSADPHLVQALVCAAVRETFEESGVLLAEGPTVEDDAVLEADRRALVARETGLADLLRRRDLVLRADLLRPWAHWITPTFEPRRFDTRFFVAALPEGQAARHVGGEAQQSVWLPPAEALARNLPMLPPTAVTLDEMTAYDSVDDVLAAAERREIRPIQPEVVLDGDDAILVLGGPP